MWRFSATTPRFLLAVVAGIFVLTVRAAKAAQAFQAIHTLRGSGEGRDCNPNMHPFQKAGHLDSVLTSQV
jgi:hypothetical protein